MKFGTHVLLNRSIGTIEEIIHKMSKLSYYHADISRKVKNSKNRSFFKMAVTFDLNKIFQFCFDILKGNRKILNINSGFFMNIKI